MYPQSGTGNVCRATGSLYQQWVAASGHGHFSSAELLQMAMERERLYIYVARQSNIVIKLQFRGWLVPPMYGILGLMCCWVTTLCIDLWLGNGSCSHGSWCIMVSRKRKANDPDCTGEPQIASSRAP